MRGHREARLWLRGSFGPEMQPWEVLFLPPGFICGLSVVFSYWEIRALKGGSPLTPTLNLTLILTNDIF